MAAELEQDPWEQGAPPKQQVVAPPSAPPVQTAKDPWETDPWEQPSDKPVPYRPGTSAESIGPYTPKPAHSWSELNPLNLLGGILHAAIHPIDALNQNISNAKELFNRWLNNFWRGYYATNPK